MKDHEPKNKRDGLTKHLIVGFLFAFVLYLAGFHFIEQYRNTKGPWRIDFRADQEGHPSIAISQEKFGLTNVIFEFRDEHLDQSNTAATVIFDIPKTNTPFGKVIFLDTTVLPGTVTFDLFGHEIELLPRTLVVNFKEVPWKSDSTNRLSAKDRPRRR